MRRSGGNGTRASPSATVRPGGGPHLRVGHDVWKVIGGLHANRAETPNASAEEMLDLLEYSTGLPRIDIRAALSYYAEFPDEINEWIASNNALADRLEAQWRREQELLAGSA